MRKILYFVLFFIIMTSCHHSNKPLVNSFFADSLITYYSPSFAVISADSNISFWKRRMDLRPDDFVNGPEYASALNGRFHFYGNIDDLLEADSLYKRSNQANQEKEAGLFRTLTSLALMRHQFVQADSFLKKAIQIEGHSVPNAFLDFDVSFELGQYTRAKNLLQSLKTGNSYGYLFRRSRLEHYNGSLDTAISCMLQAAEKAGNNDYLKQIALSNAADLCIHKGNLDEACRLYTESIKMDAIDFHSLMGLGWIALVYDKNDSLAERIFQFIKIHNNAPDVLLKLEQVAEARGDSALQKKYADDFVNKVSDSAYGNMYNKYLIDLYTGILHQPAKAVQLAQGEISSRPTPQIIAWYCWSLFCNNESEQAYRLYREHVSGKPLEGLELYYMGKLMQGLNKGYNAQQFFEAAYKNKYDLSPAKQKDLEKNLE